MFSLVVCAFDVMSKKSLSKPMSQKIAPMFSKTFIVLILIFSLWSTLTFVYVRRYGSNFPFAWSYPVVPAPLVEKTVLSSLSLLMKNQLNVRISGLLLLFHWSILICMSVPTPAPHCLHYYSFPVNSEIGNESSNFILPFQTVFSKHLQTHKLNFWERLC